jgi:hypothetical protein
MIALMVPEGADGWAGIQDETGSGRAPIVETSD